MREFKVGGMLKKVFILVISLMLPMSVLADELTLSENAPKSYIVKKGDTLWDISGIFLKQPWLWPKLWRLNPEVNNPHLIYPGDELRLVFDEQGQPMLVKGKPELKWSPKTRNQLKDQSPVSTLPLHIISPYIKYDSIFTEAELEALPYVLGSDEGYKSSVDSFNIYINGDLAVGNSYAIYDKGNEIIDPETEESLGYHMTLVGTGKALRSGNAEDKVPSTLYLQGVKREVRSGSFVVPVNEGQLYPSYFSMQPVDESIRGHIIETTSGVREFGKLEVVMINKGEHDAVKAGDVFSVKRTSPGVVETSGRPIYTADASRWNRMTGEQGSDYKMPEEQIGKMMVFRVYEKVSIALVLKTQKPLRLQDAITAP